MTGYFYSFLSTGGKRCFVPAGAAVLELYPDTTSGCVHYHSTTYNVPNTDNLALVDIHVVDAAICQHAKAAGAKKNAG